MNTTAHPHTAPSTPRPLMARAISLLACLLGSAALSALADPGQDNRAPTIPSTLQVLQTNKVSFHANAVGVQIYTATPSASDPTRFVWTFVAPEAVLFDNDGQVVVLHYAGPTWESASGSTVVGARINGATVDPTAIPWLLLGA